jgi:outer membrane scaffolding protein for murein synthesis (MipA/OmpV family)
MTRTTCVSKGRGKRVPLVQSRGAWLSLLALSCGLSAARAADTTPALTDPTPAKGWIITIGGSMQYEPDFEGSKWRRFSPMPSLSWRRVGEAEGFSAPDDGLDFALYDTDRLKVGVVGDYKSGRYSGADRKLFGLRDVPWTIEAGVFAEFWPVLDRFRLRAEVKQGFHGHHGVVADLSADWVERFGSFTFSAGPRFSMGSKSYMTRNFGITPGEAALSGIYRPYRPDSGAKSAGVATALTYDWSENWATTVYARYDRLLDEAAGSPLVRVNGSRDQFTFGTTLSYSFQVGG